MDYLPMGLQDNYERENPWCQLASLKAYTDCFQWGNSSLPSLPVAYIHGGSWLEYHEPEQTE